MKPEGKKLFQNPKLRWENNKKRLLTLSVSAWIWVHVGYNWVLWSLVMGWYVTGKVGKVWRVGQLSASEEGFCCLCRLFFYAGGRLRTLVEKYAWMIFIYLFLKYIGLVRSSHLRNVTIYEKHTKNININSGYCMYHQFDFQQLYFLPKQCIYVFCVDLRKKLLFPYTALTD
jgi:hypothetical protein